MLRKIRQYPDPFLRRVCKATPLPLTAKAKRIITDLQDTLRIHGGAGLAASQIGYDYRILVLNTAVFQLDIDTEFMVMINPIIQKSSEKFMSKEACLSVPHVSAFVERKQNVKVEFIDENNSTQNIEFSNSTAACFQHEYDHLDGILYIDRLGRLKRHMLLKKIKKHQKLQEKLDRQRAKEFWDDHGEITGSPSTHTKKRKKRKKKK